VCNINIKKDYLYFIGSGKILRDSFFIGFGRGRLVVIGEKLRSLRKQKKMTLRLLGEKLGVDYSYLSRVEREKANPSMQLLEDIAVFFNVPMGSLFEFSDNEKSLMRELELNDDELIEKYNLTLDGEKVTPEKLKQALAILRALN